MGRRVSVVITVLITTIPREPVRDAADTRTATTGGGRAEVFSGPTPDSSELTPLPAKVVGRQPHPPFGVGGTRHGRAAPSVDHLVMASCLRQSGPRRGASTGCRCPQEFEECLTKRGNLETVPAWSSQHGAVAHDSGRGAGVPSRLHRAPVGPRRQGPQRPDRQEGRPQLDHDTARRLKVLAVQRDTTLHALGEETFETLLERYGD